MGEIHFQPLDKPHCAVVEYWSSVTSLYLPWKVAEHGPPNQITSISADDIFLLSTLARLSDLSKIFTKDINELNLMVSKLGFN